MRPTKLFRDFIESEKAGGLILVFATLASLLLANSPWASAYFKLWNFKIGEHNLTLWINDGLMTLFFLLIGLELKRELRKGELSNIKNAALPIFGAIGGMLIPACIYLIVTFGTDKQAGAGIPMATDIAFAVGILSLLGSKVPNSLKVFLTALAVIDDLGAILVIAVFYTTDIAYSHLLAAIGIFGVLILLNQKKIKNLFVYLIGGLALWYFMLHSGIHATIAGVLLAFVIPFEGGKKKAASAVLERFLNKPVAFIILPLFAAANTCLVLGENWYTGLAETSSIGIIIGLVLGKPLGILLFSKLGVWSNFCALPSDLKWKNILGAGMLGGIGFTMSIFITLLAFGETSTTIHSKIAILLSSLTAGIFGFLWLQLTLQKPISSFPSISAATDTQ